MQVYRRVMLSMVLAVIASPAMAQKPEPEKVDGKIEWVYDYTEGKLLSEQTNKPMFVVFRCER
ncbi:MAG: hypothetical protein AB8G99_23200 [Planctomycetaceae bacterium]